MTADSEEPALVALGWKADTLRSALAARDRLIHRARADGVPVAKIAEAVGLTGPGVRRILARSEPE